MKLSALLSASSAPNRWLLDDESGAFTFPTGVYVVWLSAVGGGGSGAIQRTSTATPSGGNGADGLFRVPVRGEPGAIVSYIVGAGGARATNSTIALDGNAGGNTEITLPDGRLLLARGGRGGLSTSDVTPANGARETPLYVAGGLGVGTSTTETGDVGGGGTGGTKASATISFAVYRAGGGGASLLGSGLDGGVPSLPAEIWDPNVHGYGGGGGAYNTNNLLITDASGAGAGGCVVFEWFGPEYGA